MVRRVSRYGRGRTAYLLTGNHDDAADLVQSALFKSARVWHRIGHAPAPYVRRIIYTENVSRWRGLQRRPKERLTAEPPDQAAAATPDTDLRVTLRTALSRLTAKQRTMLVLRFYEDLTESQTAAMLGVSLSTVKSQTRLALMRIRELSPDLAELVATG